MPRVSVVMPVYNSQKYLAEAIDSILAQTFSDLELIIVDDGSADSTASIVRAYAQRDSRIRFMQLARNMGIADARNHGIAAASGEFATMMDGDDISLPQRLEKQVGFLRANPAIGVVGVCGRAVNEDLAPLYDFRLPQRHACIAFDMFVGIGLIYTTIMLRLATLKALGGYEAGRRAGEERELAWRLLFEGRQRFANLPDQLLLYRRHSSGISSDRDPKRDAERLDVQRRQLEQLWGEAPADSIDRFMRLAAQGKLGISERAAAKRDMLRLIDALIKHDLVDADERPRLEAETRRRLESLHPRLWQKFTHWRRYRLPWLFPDPYDLY